MHLPATTFARLAVGAMLLGVIGLVAVAAMLLGLPAPVAQASPTPARSGAPSAPTSTAPSVTPTTPTTGGPMLTVDQRVAFWEARVAASEKDYSSTLALIDAYLERVRSTGNLDDISRAQTALERAQRLAPPNDVKLLLRQGQVAFTIHDFAGARDAAQQALDLDSGNQRATALLGDASIELGDEAAGLAAYNELAPLARTAPVLTRLARYALLVGDVETAEQRMHEAIDAAVVDGFPNQIAAYQFQLAEFLRGENRIDEASTAYEATLENNPDYVPAMAGLARIREAQGRRDEAIVLLEQGTARLPTPQFVADLGDLYALDGDQARADQSYALVQRIAEIAQATGGVYDRQLVIFLADHDQQIDEAVRLAEAEIAVRKDVFGYDALAWALYRAGRLEKARTAADQAMRLGTPDGRILYHAGMIAVAQGRTDDARTLLTAAQQHAAILAPLQVPALTEALDALG